MEILKSLKGEIKVNDEKLNIEKTDSIDSIAYDKDTGKLIILLTDGMDWLDEKRHLLLLQEKLNSYILYIDTKQYQEYLSRLGEDVSNLKTIEIKISFLFKEPDICSQLIDRAKNILNNIFNNVVVIYEHGSKNNDY